MKVNTSILLVASAAFLSATLSAQPFSEPKNRAVLSSPRTLEQYPELLRAAPSRAAPVARIEGRTEQLAKLTENRALAASPRFLEEHPELLRPEISAEKRERLAELPKNRALVASPRFLEEHPEVLRATPEFQVAPLK